jgi:hypothetical protein
VAAAGEPHVVHGGRQLNVDSLGGQRPSYAGAPMKLVILALGALAVTAYIWRMGKALKLVSATERQRFTRDARFPWWGTAILVAAFVALFALSGTAWRVAIAAGILIWVFAGSVWQYRRTQALGFDPAFSKSLLQVAVLGSLGTVLLLAWIILP